MAQEGTSILCAGVKYLFYYTPNLQSKVVQKKTYGQLQQSAQMYSECVFKRHV